MSSIEHKITIGDRSPKKRHITHKLFSSNADETPGQMEIVLPL